MIFQNAVVSSPLGPLALWASDDALVGLEFAGHGAGAPARAARDPAGAATRLEAYFSGALEALDAQPVAYRGSAFQRAVWDALRTIPAGATLSYARLAARVGRPL